jgi:two-component sensor histidine kinase
MGTGENATTTLAMVIHELATNSVKHGALSAQTGLLDISSTTDDQNVFLVWAETGGPPIADAPEMRGFGSTMISRIVAQQLGGSIDYDWQTSGLVVTLRMLKNRLAL